MEKIGVFIESGRRKTFAGAVRWPGWCRWGKGEQAALISLLEYGERYASVLENAAIDFQASVNLSGFEIVERHQGNATTDFGAHDVLLDGDHRPVESGERILWQKILKESWNVFDQAVVAVGGRTLRLGPRGGGRDLEKILLHVLQADQAYLRRVAWKVPKGEVENLGEQIKGVREMILQALDHAIQEGLPEQGPRGGKIWPVRFFIRRVVWHLLDHAWEIEDRIL